jgi:glycosyltransferase involved in cell wall biosynthesis
MKILLVNRHMNIGGVETYLYRLCAGLRARGHETGLLTEGGLYETKAAEAGARLHKVKSLSHDWESALPEITAQGYEIVHAHNYHSARVGHCLSKRLGLPYVMSVHGPRPRIKQLLFRDWSDEVVVMSEGDRDNICWFGGVPAKRIILSFYAIDTDRFRPGIDTAPLRSELGLAGDSRPLVFISRFSNRKADVGHALLSALPSLAEQIPGLVLLIVGEGPEEAGLRQHAEKVNAAASRPLARMIGPRKDVEAFMNLAELSVCTATTALESMACGTPTLAAGRTGFFGIVGVENIEAARAICFADHGVSPQAAVPTSFLETVPALFSDIGLAKARALATAGYIAKNYSISRMAEQMEGVYRRCIERRRTS